MTNYTEILKLRIRILKENIESLKISNERFRNVEKIRLIRKLEEILENNEKELLLTTNPYNN